MNTSTTPYNSTDGRKFKPYRNRPSKRQALLEVLSFLLIIASAPAFLGGVFSIFVFVLTFALGFIGLFAWTRRHAALFSLLAILVIMGCIVNIILRAVWTAQCMPFYRYNTGDGRGNLPINPTNDLNDTDNQFDQSIWCGNKYVVYITHGVILAHAIPALFIALSLLFRKKRNVATTGPVSRTTTESKTRTFATA